MTIVVNIKHERYTVYIGRGYKSHLRSKWANPFHIGKDGTREEVIAKYRAWITKQPKLMAALPELKGQVLGCFCSPLPCHGQVLIELLENYQGACDNGNTDDE